MASFKQLLKLLAAMAMLGGPISSALAEGRCPPGQYPVGGQGVGGCAPIPGYRGGSSSQQNGPQMRRDWAEERYGAFVLSDSTPDAGVAADEGSDAEAKGVALTNCRRNGAKDCRIVLSYKNQCASWVVPPRDAPGAKVGFGLGNSPEAAVANGMERCIAGAGDTCSSVYSGCSLPEWRH